MQWEMAVISHTEFRKQMMSIGIVSYTEQESLWTIMRRCGRTAGIAWAPPARSALRRLVLVRRSAFSQAYRRAR